MNITKWISSRRSLQLKVYKHFLLETFVKFVILCRTIEAKRPPIEEGQQGCGTRPDAAGTRGEKVGDGDQKGRQGQQQGRMHRPRQAARQPQKAETENIRRL